MNFFLQQVSEMHTFWTIFSIIFGAIIGSFLSVCIYRIPLGRDDLGLYEDEETEGQIEESAQEVPEEEPISVCSPKRSFCPSCKEQLLWWHNVPVLSWVILGGKCYFCKEKISARYPFVEFLSALFCFLSYYTFGFSLTAAVIYIFCCALIVITFIDYDYYIIPNLITFPGFFIACGIAVLNHFTHIFQSPVASGIPEAFYGVLAGAGFLFLVSEVYLRLRKREGLGMGDVKLLAVTGALLGPEAAIYTIFMGSLLGSVLGGGLILFFSRRFSQHLPFGPYLAFATVLYIFTGLDLVGWMGGVFVSVA